MYSRIPGRTLLLVYLSIDFLVIAIWDCFESIHKG
jgi:hypothetical protein